MRLIKTLAGIIAVMLLIDGCKKSSSSEGSGTSIVGTWELRQLYGDVGTINYPAGNNSILTFTDGTYSSSDTTKSLLRHQTGTFKIINDNSAGASTGIIIKKGQFTSRLILDNDTTSDKIFIQMVNNQLIFLSGNFQIDAGVQLTYEKN
jgi:hypothetical protein